ncbi:MAG TPA: AAA family ATPase [Pedobacter sp.]|uniref:AAA family ATPase n=1 Tax=Pedobacter sp. TaxID=1411316 RepID=UPI002BA55B54|nr:AAA family ATPase [Pedobacter sp.]HMI02154.1 AAA family ATPase [Pedobacter sp.]
MENLKSNIVIQDLSMTIIRNQAREIDWNDRLIGILGARGTGKTTLLLQRLKAEYGFSGDAMYITMDDINSSICFEKGAAEFCYFGV